MPKPRENTLDGCAAWSGSLTLNRKESFKIQNRVCVCVYISYSRGCRFLRWIWFIALSVDAGLNCNCLPACQWQANASDLKVNPFSWSLNTTYFLFHLRSPKSWQTKYRFLKYFVYVFLNWKLTLSEEFFIYQKLI